VAERFNKTLKTKIFKYMTANQSFRFIDVLQDLVHAYNTSKHRTIGMSPNSVTKDNEWEVAYSTYLARHPKKGASSRKRKSYAFQKGDYVRLSHVRKPFTRAYDEHWTGEVFKIKERSMHSDIPMYKLVDWNDEDVTGGFYEAELQKIELPADGVFKIEKVLKRRVRGGKEELLVRWWRWPPAFDSWISASQVVKNRAP